MRYDFQGMRQYVARARNCLDEAIRSVKSESGVAECSEVTIRRLIDAMTFTTAVYLAAVNDVVESDGRGGFLLGFHQEFSDAILKAMNEAESIMRNGGAAA